MRNKISSRRNIFFVFLSLFDQKLYIFFSGWNAFVKDIHAVARDAFWLWSFYRRPNQGQLYHSMRSSRAHFKFPLKFAKRIEDTAKADSLANDRGAKNMINFGKELAK